MHVLLYACAYTRTMVCDLNSHLSIFVLIDSEDLVARTTIVGIIVAFRKLSLDALNSVLSYRIPFLLSSITDFKKNLPDRSSTVRLIGQYCRGWHTVLVYNHFYYYMLSFSLFLLYIVEGMLQPLHWPSGLQCDQVFSGNV